MSDYTINPFIENLSNEFSNIIVLHSSKLNGKEYKELQLYDNINYKNIRIKNMFSVFYNMIHDCKVFIVFGHNSFIEFILSLLCKIKNKNSLYVQHGLYVEQNKFVINNYFISVKKYLCYASYFFPLFFMSPMKVLSSTKKYLKEKSEVSFCNHSFFYDAKSSNLINTEGELHIVGSPTTLSKNGPKNKHKTLSYIQGGFISHGITKLSRSEEKLFFKKLIQKFKYFSFKNIKFFLHPREKYSDYSYLEDFGVEIFQGKNMHYKLSDSNLVVGHYSSLLEVCHDFGMQVIKLEYPKLKYLNKDLVLLKIFFSSENYTELLINRTPNKEKYISFDEFALKVINYI
tara:strand:+ start:763 stop:1794 length:1032 start_codon:yes stop_codon:yes gene_type:complete